MIWRLKIAKRAQKQLEKFPVKEQGRIMEILDRMASDPFGGNLVRLKAERATWRRRIGNYRIFFDVHPDQLLVDIVEIVRRTSSTY